MARKFCALAFRLPPGEWFIQSLRRVGSMNVEATAPRRSRGKFGVFVSNHRTWFLKQIRSSWHVPKSKKHARWTFHETLMHLSRLFFDLVEFFPFLALAVSTTPAYDRLGRWRASDFKSLFTTFCPASDTERDNFRIIYPPWLFVEITTRLRGNKPFVVFNPERKQKSEIKMHFKPDWKRIKMFKIHSNAASVFWD